MGSPRALLAQGLCTYCSLCQERSSSHTHMALSLPPFRYLFRYPSSVSPCLIILIFNSQSIILFPWPASFFSENYSIDIMSYTNLAFTCCPHKNVSFLQVGAWVILLTAMSPTPNAWYIVGSPYLANE